MQFYSWKWSKNTKKAGELFLFQKEYQESTKSSVATMILASLF